MRLTAGTVVAYLDHAFAQMLAVAERLGDERVNVRPHGPTTNSGAALITHTCGVVGYWLGHVVLGRPTDRDRDAELVATATVAELRDLLGATLAQARDDLTAIDRGEGSTDHPQVGELTGIGDPAGTDPSVVVLHVLEEVYQHLGHLDLTADALLLG